jgi:Acyl-CoA thioesterase C-terminal domain/Acyl-CoA thioesterase N-terminal domain
MAMTEPDEPEASAFDAATAVTPTAVGDTHALSIDPGWTVGTKPNGGYLLAAVARAARAALAHAGSTHRDPLAVSATYVAAPDPGPAQVRTEVLRTGRTASQVAAHLVQGGRTCVEATLTVGTLDPTAEPWWADEAPVELPPPDACRRLPSAREGAPFTVPIMDRVDLRLDPAVLGFADGEPGGGGELRGWLSFADARPFDSLALLFALDALPPATFELAATGWVPTLQLTTYVRAVPAPGPLRVRQRARLVEAGLVDELCEVWDSRGRLVGTATQLAAIRVEGAVPPV